MLYEAALGIHACALLAGLLLFVAGELLLIAARWGHHFPARMALLSGRAAGMLTGIGVLAGIVLVIAGGWSLLTPWLVVSFALIAALLLVGRTFVDPWEARFRSALDSDAMSAQIEAVARERTPLIGRVGMITLFATVAGLMMLKPDLASFLSPMS